MSRLLPIYQQFDQHMNALVTEARNMGATVPCKQGCDACCYDVAYTTEIELEDVVARIRRMSHYRQWKILQAAEKWERRIRAVGIDPDLAPVDNKAPDIRQTYYSAHAACPLLDLERHRCMVYKERPLACRGHWLVNQPASQCANVDKDPMTQNISNVEHLAVAVMAIYALAPPQWGLLPRLLQKMLQKEQEHELGNP